MGVRGLTTYIAKNAEKFLKPYELHDCNIVIDGDSLALNLYKWDSNSNSAFGGDYDQYYQFCIKFFNLLKQCNVTPYILMDGGYERKKLRTVCERTRGKIALIKHLNPNMSSTYFPLMLREVFVDACKFLNIDIMRCLFEADNEIAILAKKLNCPVLSYDSDFYIYNVKYIPSITLTLKCYKKIIYTDNNCDVKVYRKTKINKQINISNITKNESNIADSYYYIDCSMYMIENLVTYGSLKKEMFPLFAALIGNDYIERRIFGKFYAQLKKVQGKRMSGQQKRIETILRWLKHHTYESAVKKIMLNSKVEQRDFISRQMNMAMSSYNSQKSEAFDYFQLTEDDIQIDDDEIGDEHFGETDSNGTDIETDSECCEEDEINFDSNESENNCDSEIDDDQIDSTADNVEPTCSDNELSNSLEEIHINDTVTKINDDVCSDDENREISICENAEDEDTNNEDYAIINTQKFQKANEKICDFPDWFVKFYNNCEVSRFCVDLIHLKMYVNAPQIENFLLPDSNEISINYLLHMFSLLNYPNIPNELVYLTRVTNLTNVMYKRLKSIEIEKFDKSKNLEYFKLILNDISNIDEIFKEILLLPKQMQLYFLCIIIWLKKSKYVNKINLIAVIISFMYLNIIDKRIQYVRDENLFKKNYNTTLERLATVKRDIVNEKTVSEDIIDDTHEINLNKKSFKTLTKTLKIENYVLTIKTLIKLFQKANYSNKLLMNKNCNNNTTNTLLHINAELQSVIYNMNTLNTLLDKPFKRILLGNYYNGLFIYNVYTILKNRININNYIKTHLLQDKQFYTIYTVLYKFFDSLTNIEKKNNHFIELNKNKSQNTSNNNILKKKNNNKDKKKINKNKLVNTNIVKEEINEDDGGCGDSFYDLNNRFSMLLKI